MRTTWLPLTRELRVVPRAVVYDVRRFAPNKTRRDQETVRARPPATARGSRREMTASGASGHGPRLPKRFIPHGIFAGSPIDGSWWVREEKRP
ncbi:unnamed protein product [Lampetra fluviatilis]